MKGDCRKLSAPYGVFIITQIPYLVNALIFSPRFLANSTVLPLQSLLMFQDL